MMGNPCHLRRSGLKSVVMARTPRQAPGICVGSWGQKGFRLCPRSGSLSAPARDACSTLPRTPSSSPCDAESLSHPYRLSAARRPCTRSWRGSASRIWSASSEPPTRTNSSALTISSSANTRVGPSTRPPGPGESLASLRNGSSHALHQAASFLMKTSILLRQSQEQLCRRSAGASS